MTSQNYPVAAGPFKEIGTTGIDTMGGMITEPYISELQLPSVIPIYDRMWRSDPELSIVRMIFDAWSGQQNVTVELPESKGDIQLDPPTDDDKKARDFYESVLYDMDGGFNQWLSSCVTRVPFWGWGWWEVLPGVRRKDWHAPDPDDTWRSDQDDGLIGLRRLAFRRYDSFFSWDINEPKGILKGLNQLDIPNQPVTIPLERSLHVTFGDHDNPEGLPTMEALYRLERYKHNLEIVYGIGMEHSAGIASFSTESKLDPADEALIRRAARSVASAQQGNYVSLPKNILFEMKDVSFAAAADLLKAIRYYGVLKLALWSMQWVALSALTDVGSLASMQDSSQMALTVYNSMVEGFLRQADDQVGRRLFDYPANQVAFPNMTRRPRLKASVVRKDIALNELGQLLQAMDAILPLTLDDLNAARRESQVFPELTQEQYDEQKAEQNSAQPIPVPPAGDGTQPSTDTNATPNDQAVPANTDGVPATDAEQSGASLARRNFTVDEGEYPLDVTYEANDLLGDLDRALNKAKKYADSQGDEVLAGILEATEWARVSAIRKRLRRALVRSK